jgi:hypothetical protein
VGGGEFLEGLSISELRHRSFSSSERLVGILSPIVEPSTTVCTENLNSDVVVMKSAKDRV